ncbi:2,3-diaminopropionate biosynthesis protein SbnA [Cohnella endophytica]|uniref:2,3-diaminopropionate biosynthesis protein SbnA n=1 Tax=Cohnella endophytica TaxID=2419778 RepID=A0A494XDT0_9BACL|nr:2,3-diaminopropionate biosynthesis protein SbnA [Cohnella endophytica]RKP48032.1 2,3-diaminopropionate biosynthesis protein SbnA [Cohnella endophytica]
MREDRREELLNERDILNGIGSTIGNTPLVPLRRLFADASFEVHAKLEMMNPGGSSKDRPALRILREAIRTGDVRQGTTVIESSSGNMAISLAQLCRILGLRFICVVDPRTTDTHLRLIRCLGGEIERVEQPDSASGDYLPARIRRVQQLRKSIRNSYWTNQYGNPNNYLAHYEGTMSEILSALPRLDYLFCGVSSCGTLRGCAEKLKDSGNPTRIIAVDAVGSVIFGGNRGNRRFPGLGAAIAPSLSRPELVDRVVYVSERDCVAGCMDLVRSEAILAGASSGGIVSAIRSLSDEIPPGAICAAILPDRGERYLDTVFDEDWVRRHALFE